MKKFLVGILVFAFSNGLKADEPISQPISKPNFLAELSGNYTRASIKPNNNHSLDGNLGGVQGIFQYIPENFIYAAAGGSFRYGTVKGHDGKRNILDGDVYERIGYTLGFKCSEYLFTPFIGFGYRHLYHHLKYDHTRPRKFRYNEFYIPVGVLAKYNIFPCFSAGLNLVWMPQCFPTLTINIIDGARWVLKRTYKNFKVSLPLSFHVQSVQGLSILLKPSFEFWQDGETTAKTILSKRTLGLPKDTYHFWGVDLGAQYAF